jgi:2-oxoglutarate ferredoxin oxidoreductase subunit alpha
MQPTIDRGELMIEPRTDVTDLAIGAQLKHRYAPGSIGAPGNGYLRFENTESGISPRAVPGLKGYVHVVATDEHNEDGVLISDEFTNPHKRRQMVEKRARKFQTVARDVPLPKLEGPEDAEVTLVGWGSTYGIITEAIELLRVEGIAANHLPIKWIVPFHTDTVTAILSRVNRIIIVENNFSGQFARYLRSETGIAADGNIRKYDGEPFQPHHIVDGVVEQLAGKSKQYVPQQEIMV